MLLCEIRFNYKCVRLFLIGIIMVEGSRIDQSAGTLNCQTNFEI